MALHNSKKSASDNLKLTSSAQLSLTFIKKEQISNKDSLFQGVRLSNEHLPESGLPLVSASQLIT